MKIGIFGIGAIGSVISMSLDERNELYYFNRSSKSEISILKENKCVSRKMELSKSAAVNDLDWLIVCLKAYHFAKAETDLKQLIAPKTKVAVVRNGLAHEQPYLKFSTSDKILACIIDSPTQKVKQGVYYQLRHPKVTIPKSTLATAFENLFLRESIEISQVADFKTKGWEKLIESSALGAILCLTGETCHIFKDEKVLELYAKLIDEGIEVALADGAKIDAGFKSNLITKLKNYPPTKGSSMLADRLVGHPIEVAAKNGIITQLAKKYSLETPLNDFATILLKKINSLF